MLVFGDWMWVSGDRILVIYIGMEIFLSFVKLVFGSDIVNGP